MSPIEQNKTHLDKPLLSIKASPLPVNGILWMVNLIEMAKKDQTEKIVQIACDLMNGRVWLKREWLMEDYF